VNDTPGNSQTEGFKIVSIRQKITASLAVGFAVALMVVGFGGAVGARADTIECAGSVQVHGGVIGQYCASQEIVPANVELAVPNRAGAYSRVTFKAASTTNAQQDFEFYNPSGAHPDNQKLAEWAPRGDPSGLFLTVSNSGRLVVLKRLQAGGNAPGQQWVAVGPDASGAYAWVSEANGRAVSDPNGAPYTRATLVSGAGSPFTYEQTCCSAH
jgi:hypothetical protein